MGSLAGGWETRDGEADDVVTAGAAAAARTIGVGGAIRSAV
jgi:hypothetical protein